MKPLVYYKPTGQKYHVVREGNGKLCLKGIRCQPLFWTTPAQTTPVPTLEGKRAALHDQSAT